MKSRNSRDLLQHVYCALRRLQLACLSVSPLFRTKKSLSGHVAAQVVEPPMLEVLGSIPCATWLPRVSFQWEETRSVVRIINLRRSPFRSVFHAPLSRRRWAIVGCKPPSQPICAFFFYRRSCPGIYDIVAHSHSLLLVSAAELS